MIKCPNCGSNAQMKYCFTDHLTSVHATEQWRCGCGCIVNRMLKEVSAIITYPNGKIEHKETR